MERLLDALVGIEIVDVEKTDGKALYSSTDVANLYLAKASPKSLFDMIIYQSKTIYPLWGNMADAVREGKNQYEKTFGHSSDELFEAVYRSEDEMQKFMGLMNSTWVIDGHDVVTAFDLSPFKTVVDLGGCTGALAREVSKAYPDSSVTVFDLPKVVEMAKKHYLEADDTISFQEGDFFSSEIPAADVYILARIIHDWKEEKCVQLLKRLHSLCQPGGGVLIVEALLFENKRGPVMAQIFSLNMLVQTEGKERTPSEYFRMLSAAGFKDTQVRRTGKSYDAILGVK
ncbi:ASMT methyltransferase, partial [Amia calva]|nr:ASMT methyltransferase [Amia calva]